MTTGTAPVRIAFFTFGRGSGGLVAGIAVWNGLRRLGLDLEFRAICDSEFGYLANGRIGFARIEREPESLFRSDRKTQLFRKLREFAPHLLIVFQSWLPAAPLLRFLDCPAVLLLHQVHERFLQVPLPTGPLRVQDAGYNRLYSIEPGFLPSGFSSTQPLVICNHEDALSRQDARAQLGARTDAPLAVFAQNGLEHEINELRVDPSIDLSEFEVVRVTNRTRPELFPLIECANGIDLLVAGAGYNTFYESRYFDLRSQFTEFPRNAEDLSWRIRTNAEYRFDTNGADMLAPALASLL